MVDDIDLIEHRYGWTDDVVLNLSVDRYIEIVTVVSKRTTESMKFELQASVFPMWVLLTTVYKMKTNWLAFLKQYGLTTQTVTPLTDAERVKLAKDAIEKAEKIRRRMPKPLGRKG